MERCPAGRLHNQPEAKSPGFGLLLYVLAEAMMSSHHSRNRTRHFSRKSVQRASLAGDVAPRVRTVLDKLESRVLFDALAWTSGVSLPTGIGGASVINVGYDVVLAGGDTASNSTSGLNTVYQLSSGTSAWQAAPNLDTGVISAGIGQTGQWSGPYSGGPDSNFKYTSDIFVYGGTTGGTATSGVQNYSLNPQGENVTATSMTTARTAMAYATDPATGDLYAIGGKDASNTALPSAEIYDPNTDTWNPIASLPTAVYGATAASDGAGHILVFGGDDSSGNPVSNVYSYTIVTNTWTQVSSMPVATSYSTAVYAFYGEIILAGGKTSAGATANVEIYNPVTDTWANDTPLPYAVYSASGVIDNDPSTGAPLLDIIGGFTTSSTAALTSVSVSPVTPPSQALPQLPQIKGLYGWALYNGAPQPIDPFVYAVGPDGVTPVNGTFTFTYDGSSTPPTNVGSYNVIAYFTSSDPGYVNTIAAGQMYIAQATPTVTLAGTGTHTWTGQPMAVTASQVGVDGTTPVAGNFAITYNGSTTAPSAPGAYNVSAVFTSTDPNYANVTTTGTITIPDPTIPSGVAVTGTTTSSLTVSWNPVTETTPGTPTYNIDEQLWHPGTHGPKGGGGTPGYYYYVPVATGITSTSYTISGLGTASYASGFHTYEVSSTNSTSKVTSAFSSLVSGQPLYAPTLMSNWGLEGGALVGTATVEVGQTIRIGLFGSGNETPVYSVVSGPPTMSIAPIVPTPIGYTATATITYTPTAADVGVQTGTFMAKNSLGSATGTFSFTVNPQTTLASFAVNDGSAQRAMVDSLSVTFSRAVVYPINGITLTQRSTTGGAPTSIYYTLSSTDGKTWTLTFPYDGYVGNSLPDGSYDLNVNGAAIVDDNGAVLNGVNQTFSFYRLYGDFNGDGVVNGSDFGLLAGNFGKAVGAAQTPGTLWYLSYDGSGVVNGADFGQFAARFGATTTLASAVTPTIASPTAIVASTTNSISTSATEQLKSNRKHRH
jgi:hypothetical protein